MSEDLDADRERLAQLDDHIAESETRLIDLIQRADDLRASEGNLHAIKAAITTLDAMLVEWRSQRDLITERLKSSK